MTTQQEQQLFSEGFHLHGQMRFFRNLLAREVDEKMRECYKIAIAEMKDRLMQIKNELFFSNNLVTKNLN